VTLSLHSTATRSQPIAWSALVPASPHYLDPQDAVSFAFDGEV
jgi:hypothetical protein